MHRLIVVAVIAATLALASPARADDIARMDVIFEVDNVNRSALSCSTNSLRYRVRGEVVGPASLLHGGPIPVATLYLHEFSFGRFFWRFDDVPGYDHATELARAGHVSVVVDRLGYDNSDHPPGAATCLGAHADITAQIARHLRQGTYTVGDGGRPITVQRLVLAGHSVGGSIAELAAHSPQLAPDLQLAGLMIFAWADQGYSARSVEQSVRQGAECLPGGEPAYPGGPPGYAYFGRTETEFRDNVFKDADPAVVERATAKRNRDPCGDNATLARVAVVNQLGVKSITVPVLLVFGDKDAVFQAGAMQDQAALFEGSSSVTTKSIPGAGHALTLERSAPLVRSTTAAWLTASGLAVVPGSPSEPAVESTGPPPADHAQPPLVAAAPAVSSRDGATLPVTGGSTPVALLLGALLVLRYVLSSARRSTSSTNGTMSAGGLLPRKARNSGMAAAGSSLSWNKIMPLKKRASG